MVPLFQEIHLLFSPTLFLLISFSFLIHLSSFFRTTIACPIQEYAEKPASSSVQLSQLSKTNLLLENVHVVCLHICCPDNMDFQTWSKMLQVSEPLLLGL